MQKKGERKNEAEIHAGKEGAVASPGFLGRMESEGERFLKGLSAFARKHIPEPQRKAAEKLAEQTRGLLSRPGKAVEENARKVVQGLKIPTRKDWEGYYEEIGEVTRRWRQSIDGEVKRGLNRFHFATNNEVEELAGVVKRLREDVDALRSRSSTRKKAAAQASG